MKFSQYHVLVLFFALLVSSCSIDDDEELLGQFPEEPVNFEAINSVYDDYNSASPYYLYQQFPYLFSSNRGSSGGEFDIVNFIVEYYYIEDTEEAIFDILDYGVSSYDSILTRINTSSNEFGPYIMYSRDYLYDFLFYATDSAGNLDIGYSEHSVYEDTWEDPIRLDKINTEFNEAYPSFTSDQGEMYFCSDKNGDYDIYKVGLSGYSVSTWLKTEDLPAWTNCDILNSSGEDKCPYINGNLMVFASNREGGYGGYDLYYSEFINGSWTEPINFGEKINTEYDEFRPIAIYAGYYVNDVMLFSSNRPGGLGGFDLYYVGIPKLIL